MDWKFLFLNFEGRIHRKDFWIGFGVLFLANIVISLIIAPLALVLSLALMYPGFAVAVKRCHDRGKSGWWSLLLLIPLVGLIWAIIDLGILKGVVGANEYGADPLGGEAIAPPESGSSDDSAA